MNRVELAVNLHGELFRTKHNVSGAKTSSEAEHQDRQIVYGQNNSLRNALKLINQGNLVEAQMACRKIIDNEPNNFAAHFY